MSDGVIIALIAALSGGAVTAMIAGFFQMPKNRAEAQKIVAETGKSLDDRWRGWIETLETEMSEMRKEIKELKQALADRDIEVRHLDERLDWERRATRKAIGWGLILRDMLHDHDLPVEPAPPEIRTYIASIADFRKGSVRPPASSTPDVSEPPEGQPEPQ